MATINIPFSEIEFHEEITNPREELKDIPELISSIKSVGLQVPLTVLHRENKEATNGDRKDRYFLVVGFRRHEAIRRIREENEGAFKKVEVKKFSGSIAEAQVLNLTENIQRSELSPIEIANGVEILLNLGFKQKDIAEKIGKSQTWVSNAIQFRRQATPQLQQAVKEGQITYGFGREIATLPDNEQREHVAQIAEGVEIATEVAEEVAEDLAKAAEREVRKTVRELSGRAIRPQTSEIRYELSALSSRMSEQNSDDFELGLLVALGWVLGERKTLKRPS
jgi:ParB family chromosome partitioning protein